jgi:phosphoribosylanthranilate isomerase
VHLVGLPDAALQESRDLVRARSGGGVILAGGLDGTNVERAIHTVRPYGVDANSRLKDSNGRKNRSACRAFVRAATRLDIRATEEDT